MATLVLTTLYTEARVRGAIVMVTAPRVTRSLWSVELVNTTQWVIIVTPALRDSMVTQGLAGPMTVSPANVPFGSNALPTA